MKKVALLTSWMVGSLLPVMAVVFPKDAKDFSLPSSWGEADPAMPNATSYLDFNHTGTFIASQNFAGWLISVGNASPVAVTLDLTGPVPPPMGQLGRGDGSASDDKPPFVIRKDGSSLTVKGGVWEMAGRANVSLYGGANFRDSTTTVGRTMTFADSASVKDVKSFYQAGYDTSTTRDCNNRFTVTDGATLNVTDFKGVYLSANQLVATNNVLTVSDGGTLNVSGTFVTDTASKSYLEVCDNAVNVLAGGQLVSPENKVCRIGNAASNMLVRVDGTRSTATFGQIRMGYDAKSRGNRLEVTDGGVLSAADLYVGRHGAENTLFVSNASITVAGLFTMGMATTSWTNTVHFAGEEAELILSNPALNKNTEANNTPDGLDFFPKESTSAGGGNRLIVSDGAALTNNLRIGLFRRSHDDVLRITRGGRFGHDADGVADNQLFSIGRWDAVSQNNTVYVEDGGILNTAYLRIAAVNNGLVISNGTVFCRNASGCTVGYSGTYTTPPNSVTGNHLVLKGSSPALRAEKGPVDLLNGSRIRFDVPATGLADGAVPVKAKTFKVDSTSSLEVTLDGYFETSETATYTLVETTHGITLPEGLLAQVNAELDQSIGIVSLSADKKKLMLKAYGESGLTILIK